MSLLPVKSFVCNKLEVNQKKTSHFYCHADRRLLQHSHCIIIFTHEKLHYHLTLPTRQQSSTAHFFFFLNFLFVLFFSSLFLILHRPLREIRVALPGQSTAAERAALPIPISATHSCPVCPNTACSQSAQSTTTTTITTTTITTNLPTRKGMQLDKSVQLYVISQRQLCSVSEFARAKGPGDNLPIKSAFEHLTNCFQITARGGAGPARPGQSAPCGHVRHTAVGQF